VKPISTHIKRAQIREICPNLHLIAALGTTPVPRHRQCVKSVSEQGILHTNASPLARTSRVRRARPNSKIHISSLNQRKTVTRPSTCPRSSRTRVEPRIESWRQRRGKERKRRKSRIERPNGRSAHQLRPALLNLIPVPSPSRKHRPTLTPIQRQSPRRLRARILIVLGHAQKNEMKGVGGHEDVASHANHLVIETAVAALVQGVDASVISTREER